jgi:hypothetical protein
MSAKELGPAGSFAVLVEEFGAQPGVIGPGQGARGFGASALRVNGAIFAMLSNGQLVVKLPVDRVDALIATGACGPYDAGKGRPLKEWAAVATGRHSWSDLAREAHDYVVAKRR